MEDLSRYDPVLDEDPVEEGWTVTSAAEAEWALRKIRQAREQRDREVEACEGMIRRYGDKIAAAESRCGETEAFFSEHLRRWFDTQSQRETKTGFTVDLPSGKLTAMKAGKVDWEVDEEALLPFLKRTAPELIRTKESVAWGELKRHLVTKDGVTVYDGTGEVVDGITATQLPPEFRVRV